MRVTRELELKVLFMLNESMPPVVRDAKWFGRLLLRLAFGKEAESFATFRERAFDLSDAEFADVYRQAAAFLRTETDLNTRCLQAVQDSVKGTSVLEVGCGGGLLAGVLSKVHDVTACDIVVRRETAAKQAAVTFCESSAEALPFRAKAFDTVVTTHTLEHLRDIVSAISELRRIARERIVVVVPAERPYRYTLNLHLHFFPYPYSLRALMGPGRAAHCEVLGGDLFYVEDLPAD